MPRYLAHEQGRICHCGNMPRSMVEELIDLELIGAGGLYGAEVLAAYDLQDSELADEMSG